MNQIQPSPPEILKNTLKNEAILYKKKCPISFLNLRQDAIVSVFKVVGRRQSAASHQNLYGSSL